MPTNPECPACGEAIAPGAVRYECETCGALYHDPCWTGTCAHPAPIPVEDTRPTAPPSPRPEHPEGRLVRGGLPIRVKAGELSPQEMSLETGAGRVQVPWHQVQLICLGVIQDLVGDQAAQRSGMRNMIRKLFFGEGDSNRGEKAQFRETVLLDVYVHEQAVPYRFDAGTVNYKSLLGLAGYVSSQNFLRLAARIVNFANEARLDPSIVGLLTNHRERIRRFATVYDFEMESAQNRDRISDMAPRSRVELNPAWLENSDAEAALEETP